MNRGISEIFERGVFDSIGQQNIFGNIRVYSRCDSNMGIRFAVFVDSTNHDSDSRDSIRTVVAFDSPYSIRWGALMIWNLLIISINIEID